MPATRNVCFVVWDPSVLGGDIVVLEIAFKFIYKATANKVEDLYIIPGKTYIISE